MTLTASIARPSADEYAPYYAGYIAHVPDGGDPRALLTAQLESVPALLGTVPESRAGHRYASDKWSIREVVGHLGDSERVFAYRLMRIARADATPLPGFEENDYVREAQFDARALADVVNEWAAVRRATLALVSGLDASAWPRRGVANGKPVSARAIAFIIAGHTHHHVGVLRDRYGLGAGAGGGA